MYKINITSLKRIEFDYNKFQSRTHLFKAKSNIGFMKSVGSNLPFGYVPYLIDPSPIFSQGLISRLKKKGFEVSQNKFPVKVKIENKDYSLNLSIKVFYPSIIVVNYNFVSEDNFEIDNINKESLSNICNYISSYIKEVLETMELPKGNIHIVPFTNSIVTLVQAKGLSPKEFFNNNSSKFITYLTKHASDNDYIKDQVVKNNVTINHDDYYTLVNKQGAIMLVPESIALSSSDCKLRFRRLFSSHLYAKVIEYLFINTRKFKADKYFLEICFFNLKKVVSNPKSCFNCSYSHLNMWNIFIKEFALEELFTNMDPSLKSRLDEHEKIWYELAEEIYGKEMSYYLIKDDFNREFAKGKFKELFGAGMFNLALEIVKKYTIK